MASGKKGGKQVMTIAPLSSTPTIGILRVPEARRSTNSGPAAPAGDDIFQMDEIEKDVIPPLSPPPMEVSSSLQPTSGASMPSRAPEARPWRMPVVQAPAKSDFRSILAEAEFSKIRPITVASPGAFPVNRTASTGQVVLPSVASSPSSTIIKNPNDRFKARSANAPGPVDGTQARSSIPWRLPTSSAPSPPSTPQPSREIPRNTPPSGLSRIMKEGPTSSSLPGSPAQPQTPTKVDSKGKAGLGPTFTPTKSLAPAAPSVSRRTSETSSAWAVNPSTPPEPEPVMTPSASPPSFLAIQQQQIDQGKAPGKAKKSLREIQEEEQARQQEEDFMKWWAAEEERMKAESSMMPEGAEGDKRSKRSRKKPPFKGTMSKGSGVPQVQVKDVVPEASTSTTSGGESKLQGSKQSRRPRGRLSNPQAQQL